MEDSREARSESNFNTLHYLLNKQHPPIRKTSEHISYISQESERPNFLLRHQAQQYSVLRVYINSLTSEQIRLYYSKFNPKIKEGTICIIHGYGQSTDDYIQMAQYFARNRFVVNMVDLRSFGYSGGRRVNQSIESILSDIQNLLRRCCEIGLPTYIIAHGFGSLLVLALLQQNPDLPLSGVITLSPLFTFPFFHETTLISKSLLRLLSWLLPDLLISNKINPTSLTNNPHKIKQCFQGVFSFQYITIDMVQEYTALCEEVMRKAHLLTYPLFVCYGAEDSIQPKTAVKQFYQLSGSKEKSSFVFRKGFHQLFKDESAEQQLFPKMLEWLLDLRSNKNQVKWGKTSPFSLQLGSKVPLWLKYAVLALIPIMVGIWLRCRRVRHA